MPTQQTNPMWRGVCVGTLHLREHLNIRVRVDKNNCFDADYRKYITHSRCAEWMKFCFVFSGLFTCLYWSLCSSRCDGGAPTRMIILPGESREKKTFHVKYCVMSLWISSLSLSCSCQRTEVVRAKHIVYRHIWNALDWDFITYSTCCDRVSRDELHDYVIGPLPACLNVMSDLLRLFRCIK